MNTGVILISGIPGAGKTTVSRLLAERLGNGVHIESDVLQEWIRSGGIWPDGKPQAEADRQLRLRTTIVCQMADTYRAAGFTPVIDDVIVGGRSGRLPHFLADLKTRPVHFVLLTPDKRVVQQRDFDRGYKQVFSTWGHLDETMRRDTPHVGLWLDSSEQTAEESVEEILARVDETILPEASSSSKVSPITDLLTQCRQ